MKHIKEFENLNNTKPEIGDYVLCKENDFSMSNFLDCNIGKILEFVKKDNGIDSMYIIEYSNVPRNLRYRFFPPNNNYNYLRFSHIDNIEYWSKNKEDLEPILQAKKYNL